MKIVTPQVMSLFGHFEHGKNLPSLLELSRQPISILPSQRIMGSVFGKGNVRDFVFATTIGSTSAIIIIPFFSGSSFRFSQREIISDILKS
ncbi:MAG: hypothetical protein KAT35_00220 [Candidatus Aenigmarchaeota archaeon]|nr:hypothetical protein [Candidatus Aenigmarchaeota archaeon]